jgi:hypothetical protein
MIHYRSITSVIDETGDGDEERETKKRRCKFDEDESPDGAIPLVKVVLLSTTSKDNPSPAPPAKAPKMHHKASSSRWTSWLHERRLERRVCSGLFHKNSSSHIESREDKESKNKSLKLPGPISRAIVERVWSP